MRWLLLQKSNGRVMQPILTDKAHTLHERMFALINICNIETSGEHWMGVVMNKSSNLCGYFDSFGRNFKWLEETLAKHYKLFHKTRHVVQSETSSTYGLHAIYLII